jgi:UTP--glucose-1-phosphate uridylyltransferase
LRIRHVVEKPAPEVAPSNLAIVGRYVLPGRIFELLDEVQPGAGGEIQLTDAIAMLLAQADVRAWRFEGTRFDCGSKLGLVKATLHMAMRDPQLAGPTREFIGTL